MYYCDLKRATDPHCLASVGTVVWDFTKSCAHTQIHTIRRLGKAALKARDNFSSRLCKAKCASHNEPHSLNRTSRGLLASSGDPRDERARLSADGLLAGVVFFALALFFSIVHRPSLAPAVLLLLPADMVFCVRFRRSDDDTVPGQQFYFLICIIQFLVFSTATGWHTDRFFLFFFEIFCFFSSSLLRQPNKYARSHGCSLLGHPNAQQHQQ